MTSQKVTMNEILGSLVKEYGEEVNIPSDNTDETSAEIIIPDLEKEISIETSIISEDPTKISSNIVEQLRERYGKIELEDDGYIICDGRYGVVCINDKEIVKYIISKNVIEVIDKGIMVFNTLRFFESPDQTFYAAPTYFKPFFGQNYYGNTESTRIHNAIHLMKDAEFFLYDDKT